MDIWNIAEYACWGIAGVLVLWMIADMVRVGAEYDEALLLSSREGADELLERGNATGEAK
ncbi:MAG: hypothetical protein NFCOHLIN_02606 [Gammaproteobacteria bacterium]|nr:hypothetical protein [Gammaproteobacteria bacterium]